jgi:hypothetical protein
MGTVMPEHRAPAGFTASRLHAHAFLTHRWQAVVMITRRMRIRRQLRTVRASALSEKERRQELREAEANGTHGRDRDEPAGSAAPPHAAGDDGARRPPAGAERRAGAGEED